MKQVICDLDELKQSALVFKRFLDETATILKRMNDGINQAEQTAGELAAGIAGDIELGITRTDTMLQIDAGSRSIMLVPLPGVAHDARLARPKGKNCAEILVFGHTVDRQTGWVISCLRVYADGSCTDGQSEWNLDEVENGMRAYLSDLIKNDLLCCEVFWPPIDELKPLMEEIPIGQVQTAQLSNPCIGFECSLRRNGKVQR